MNVLVTGFEPFGGEKINPAQEVLRLLPDELGGATIGALTLATANGRADRQLAQAVADFKPDVILSIGQAGGRSEITVERIAINVDDYRIPDNEGHQPIDQPIAAAGPAAYFLTVPIKAMVHALREEGIPASVSNSAGTYLCNHIAYVAAHMAAQSEKPMRSGFIHIPFLPEQAAGKNGMPSMSLELITRGICRAIEVAVTRTQDLNETGGCIS
ncbi:MAG: pyroglutamyl-peptidase I [Ndongobacter sp.]|nr:pyroglutamyl-peptidase I [Ndongobacter sp.]